MDYNNLSDKIVRGLGVDPIFPAAAGVALALINPKTGVAGPSVDKAGNLQYGTATLALRGRSVYEDFLNTDTADQAITISAGTAAGGVAVTTTNVLQHIYTPGGNRFAQFNIGTQTSPAVMAAGGLNIAGADTAALGMELCTNAYGATGMPFVVGNSPGFYFNCKLSVGAVAGVTSLHVGFRKLQAAQVAFASYVDYAAIGLTAGDIFTFNSTTGSSNSTDLSRDTTDNFADTETHTFGVFVDGVGTVSRKIDGRAPTVDSAAVYSFPDGTMVIPYVFFISAGTATPVDIATWDVGYQ